MTQQAPGKHFRDGISLIELFRMFPDDAAAEEWFIEVRWPNGEIYCPHCGSTNIQTETIHASQSYRCKKNNSGGCGKRFSVKTGTVMHGSNLGLQKWAIATYLLTTNPKSVSSMKLHRDLKVTQKTAWMLARKIRKSFEQEDQNYNGIVEVDETNVSELEKNKLWDKKLTATRGEVCKSAVAGLKDRDTNRPTLYGFINDNVERDSTVCTDEFMSYQNVEGYDHRYVKRSVGEYVDENIHINGMELFWSVLKRAYKGTFHKISQKHLDRNVTEFAGRHNTRTLDAIRQTDSIVRGMVGKNLTYKKLVL